MKQSLSFLSLTLALLLVSGCSTAPKSQTARDDLKDTAQQTVAQFQDKDPSLQDVLNRSAGYAVFPKVAKAGAVAGGAFGRGVLYENGRMAGYTNVEQASVGLQLGGEKYSELIVFQDQDALNKFKNGTYAMSAEATAVAMKKGAAKNTQFKNGIAVFTMNDKGLMAEAALAGQKFKYEPMTDNAPDNRIDSRERNDTRPDNRIDSRPDTTK